GVEPGAAGIKPGAAGIKSGAPGPLTQAELRRRLVASRHAVSMKMAILDPGRQSCRRGPVGRSALVAGDVALAAARADMTLGAPCPSPPAKQVKPPPKGKRCQVNDETRTAAGAATRPARTGGGRRTERLGKLLRFLRPYRGQVLLIMGLVLFQTLTELYLPALMASIVDRGVVPGDIGHIRRTGGLMLLVAGVGVGAAIMTSRLSSRTASAYGRDLRGRVFRRVTAFSMREFDELGTATLITRTTNDVTQVQQVLFMTLRMFVSAPLMALGGVFMAISTDPGLSWVIVAVVPVLGVIGAAVAAKSKPHYWVLQAKIARMNRVVREWLTGVRVVQAFNREEYKRHGFGATSRDLTDTGVRVHRLMAAGMPMMMVVLNMTTVAVMWFGGIRIDQGHMQVGALMAFIQYVMLIMFSLLMVTMIFVIFPRAAVSAARINEVLEIEPEVKDA